MMSSTLVLSHDETAEALQPEPLLGAVRTALIATSRGEASVPARVAAFSPAGLLGAMPGYVPGLGLAGKLVSIFPGAGPGGRSLHQGIVALIDENDGRVLSIMNGEAVTAKRTAASATVAFEALTPPGVERIAVIGAGIQARAQLDFLVHLGISADVTVASRNASTARQLAEEFSRGDVESVPCVRPVGSIRDAVSTADVVFCCTDADRPVVQHGWLRPHAHISSVGGSRGPELDQATLTTASLFVEWAGAISSAPPAGAHELQNVPDERATLVGATLSGDQPARAADEMTVYKSTGYAALDVAAASTAYRFALEHGIGTRVDI
ncbi:ornithine cyclodeaminase family protein [Phytoactinopolyspora endophytica]|uniref:ornithine cyclodeaminase family protein n=1 Tax=Phytoactinopolyspora endophytica TaxID=1642495 RepID=UPI00197B95D6|nr:NAD(P)-binding domain-containing protein [Phytoactinopolyspora endophytica]